MDTEVSGTRTSSDATYLHMEQSAKRPSERQRVSIKSGAETSKSGLLDRRHDSESALRLRREKLLSSKRPRGGETSANGCLWSEHAVISHVEQLRKSQDLISLATAIVSLRRVMCCENPPIQLILDLGAMDIFMKILSDMKLADVHHEIIWCITNIAAGSPEQTKQSLVAAPYMIMLLESTSVITIQHAAWALGNMAADSVENREYLMSQGIATPITKLLTMNEPASQQNAAFAISNLARGTNRLIHQFIQAGIGPGIMSGLSSDDGRVVVETLWALSYLTATADCLIDTFMENGVSKKIIELLGRENSEDSAVPLLRIVGNISGISAIHGIRLIEEAEDRCYLISAIKQMSLDFRNRAVQKEALWALSNFCGCLEQRDELVGMCGLVSHLQGFLVQQSYEFKKEAAFGLCNLIYSGSHVEEITPEVIEGFLTFFKTPDLKMQELALSFLECFMRFHPLGPQLVEESGGVDFLEALQYRKDGGSISQWASVLLDRFFSSEAPDTEQREME